MNITLEDIVNNHNKLADSYDDMMSKLKELRAKPNITSQDIDIMEEMIKWLKKAAAELDRQKELYNKIVNRQNS